MTTSLGLLNGVRSLPPETLRKRVRQAEVDTGRRQGHLSEEREEIKKLRKENYELLRANEILRGFTPQEKLELVLASLRDKMSVAESLQPQPRTLHMDQNRRADLEHPRRILEPTGSAR